MRIHMPYLTQYTPSGRHRRMPMDPDHLTGHRRAVAQLPARVRAAVHRADREYEAILAASPYRATAQRIVDDLLDEATGHAPGTLAAEIAASPVRLR